MHELESKWLEAVEEEYDKCACILSSHIIVRVAVIAVTDPAAIVTDSHNDHQQQLSKRHRCHHYMYRYCPYTHSTLIFALIIALLCAVLIALIIVSHH